MRPSPHTPATVAVTVALRGHVDILSVNRSLVAVSATLAAVSGAPAFYWVVLTAYRCRQQADLQLCLC